MKTCSVCKTVKNKIEFNKSKSRKDGLQSKCKECSKTLGKIQYKKDGKKQLYRVLKRKKELANWFKSIKNEKKCVNCGEDETECIDFHHTDPSKKEGIMSELIWLRGFSKKRILEEINKCIPLCSNCHRKVHAGKFKIGLVTQ